MAGGIRDDRDETERGVRRSSGDEDDCSETDRDGADEGRGRCCHGDRCDNGQSDEGCADPVQLARKPWETKEAVSAGNTIGDSSEVTTAEEDGRRRNGGRCADDEREREGEAECPSDDHGRCQDEGGRLDGGPHVEQNSRWRVDGRSLDDARVRRVGGHRGGERAQPMPDEAGNAQNSADQSGDY